MAWNGRMAGRSPQKTCTSPPMSAVMAGAAPLYGTWTILIPVSCCSSSDPRCGVVAFPADAKFSFPGFALARAMSSWRVLALTSGPTATTCGTRATSDT